MANPTGSSSRAATAAEHIDGWLGLSHARWVQVIESIAALILSLAAVATSWSGYQAGRWAGLMAIDFSQASALRVESARATDLASRQTQIDLQLFSGWLDATAVGNQVLADFYRARFRPEFAPAFEAWLASKPLTNPQALKSPFEHPEYQLAATAEAARLEDEAAAKFEAGTVANQRGDDYVLNAVILALALFFAGIANRFSWLAVRASLLAVGLVLLAFGLLNLARYPIY